MRKVPNEPRGHGTKFTKKVTRLPFLNVHALPLSGQALLLSGHAHPPPPGEESSLLKGKVEERMPSSNLSAALEPVICILGIKSCSVPLFK